MIHWRHEEDKKKRKGSRKHGEEPAPPPSGRTSSIPTRAKRHDSAHSHLESSERGGAQSQPRVLRAASGSLMSDSDASSFTNAGSSTWQLIASDTASYFPRWQKETRSVAEKDVIEYEASERHEERQLRSLVVGLASFYNVGRTQDPFDVLPQFRNPRLDALNLSRNCKCSYVFSRAVSDPPRYASFCHGRDDAKMAATDAVTSPHHLKLYRISINLA